MLLSPQEIRTAIYTGELAKLLVILNQVPSWRNLFGPINKRMRDQELILRFLALFFEAGTYKRPMKAFLNGFMETHRSVGPKEQQAMTELFTEACDQVDQLLGPKAFKPAGSFNAALFDAVMVALAKRFQRDKNIDPVKLQSTVSALLADKSFSQWISRSTADDEVVKGRIEKATTEINKI